MFFVLEARDEQKGGIISNIAKMFSKHAPVLETREAFGARYGAIMSKKPVSSKDFGKIEALVGRYKDRLLLPPGIEYPPHMEKPVFYNYETQVIFKTAARIIELTRMPMYRRVLGLVDLNGEYSEFLYSLLKHFTSVKVLTGQTDLYRDASDKMMYELGAPVILCEDISAFSDCVLAAAPDGLKAGWRLKCPVLSRALSKNGQPCDFITDLKVEAPVEVKKALIPAGIEPHSFFGALYEYCGVDSVIVPAGRMTFCGGECDINLVVSSMVNTKSMLSTF